MAQCQDNLRGGQETTLKWLLFIIFRYSSLLCLPSLSLPRDSTLPVTVRLYCSMWVGGWEKLAGVLSSGWISIWSAGFGRNSGHRDAWVKVPWNSARDLVLQSCSDSARVVYIHSWCWWPGLIVGQHYKVVMKAHCHNSVPVLIRP